MTNHINKNILEVDNLKVHYKSKSGTLKAVDDVSFRLQEGEILGIVGESGCGKSSLVRSIMQLEQDSTKGKINFLGTDLLAANSSDLKDIRKDLQLIFQDPLASLDPRMTIGQIIAEPLKNYNKWLSKKIIQAKVLNVMQDVGLLPEYINRYPHEFSGGQCQRVGIARALILKPKLLICDEAVSALDVSIQAQIINLLKSLKKKYALSIIFISHDLSVVKYISDKIIVMYLGNIVEVSDSQHFYNKNAKHHPYTNALLASIPEPCPKSERAKLNNLDLLLGNLPSPINPPRGCKFCTRCKFVEKDCFDTRPEFKQISDVVKIACKII